MCGIAGVYSIDGKPISSDLIKKMIDIMRYRGPDDEGYYIQGNLGLGHCRLSIIDLSSAGHQPMSNEDGSVWIVFNGEIYNYLELVPDLKAKGHRFRSRSDTEVIIHAYEEYGDECVYLLNGMFAFVIWDSRTKSLFLARDHLGIKPLYYMFDGKRLIFASEVKAILEYVEVKKQPNYNAIADYFCFRFVVGDDTFFEGIKKLLPGYYAILKDEKFVTKQYWDIRFNSKNGQDESYYREKLSELLQEAVRLQLRSDVPVGAHLSGGIDSSSVVAFASQFVSHPLKTFNGRFEEGIGYNESRYAKIVAKHCVTDHYEIVPKVEDFFSILPKLIWYMDEPAAGPGIFPQYFVCKLASEHVKVVLGGQGGDELFGGYSWHRSGDLKSRLNRFRKMNLSAVEAISLIFDLTRYCFQAKLRIIPFKVFSRLETDKSIIHPDFCKRVEDNRRKYHEYYSYSATLEPLDRMLYWDVKNLLPALLQVEDRTSMAVSIESRVPILDYRIAEFAASIPSNLKVNRSISKYILRQAVKDFVPSTILNRRDKKGFPTPICIWFQKYPQFLSELLLSSNLHQRGIFNENCVRQLLSEHVNGKKDHSERIWELLNVELWHQVFID